MISSIIGFFVLVILYQLIPFCIKAFKTKNKYEIDFIKYSFLYFLLSICLFVITKPFALTFHDCYYVIPFTDNYDIAWFISFIPNLLVMVSKIIFPSIFSVCIFCSFIYSLIFGYCCSNAKREFGKLHYLFVLLFLTPSSLLFSLVQYRMIFAGYLLCFILFYIYFNRNSELKNPLKAILLGLVSAILIFLRSENISLLIIFPLYIYFIKVFNKKNFVIYTFSILMFLCPMFIYQKMHNYMTDVQYELHNLSFIIEYYKRNNIPIKEYNENKAAFNKVFPFINENRLVDKIDIDDIEAAKKVKKSLFIMHIKQIPGLIYNNINTSISNLRYKDFMHLEILSPNSDMGATYWQENISHLKLKNKIISLFAYFNTNFLSNKILKTIYNPKNYYVLMFLLMLFGFLKRNKYFILTPLVLCVILTQILIFMPFFQFFYFYPLFLIVPLMYVLAISSQVTDKN